MKRILSIITVALVLLSSVVLMAAAEAIPEERQVPRFVDNAGIVPDNDEAEINELLDSVSAKRKFDVAIVTVASTEGKEVMDYADDYYDYNGFGWGSKRDGALLVISMEPRMIWISTCGSGLKMIGEDTAELDPLMDTFYDDILEGDFSSACKTFANETGRKVASFKMRKFYMIPVALLIGFIASGVAVSSLKARQATVRFKAEAESYQIKDSLILANKADNLLYSNISRVPIQTETRGSSGGGVHVSSSGTSHGGGGRTF